MTKSKYRVKTAHLLKKCNPAIFKFKSTEEIEPLEGIIGQNRAVRALSLGLEIESPGYNLYLAGAFGTGKTSLAQKMLEEKAAVRPVPDDWCYVFNYKQPDTPRALRLSAGKGGEFKKDVSFHVENYIQQVTKAYEGEDYESQKNNFLNAFLDETNQMYLQLDEEARTYGFTVSRTQSGITTIPINAGGEVITQDEFVTMSEAERADMMKRGAVVQEKLNEAMRKYKEAEKVVRGKIKDLEQETANAVADPIFADLLEKYGRDSEILAFLTELLNDLLEHSELFIHTDENAPLTFFRNIDRRATLRRYQVNLVVDNSGRTHAPVIFESNPNYANLFGQIEYEGEFGVLATDFSKIKAGTIHRANGGYLVMHVNDLLKNYYVWDSLKRVLRNKELKVENITQMIGISNTETLQPEPIPVDMKVVLVGDPLYYYLLYRYDEEFRKLFKIRADFDTDMEKSRKHVQEYGRFIASVCRRENLHHFTAEAVAAVVDYGSRMSEDQRKLTMLFNKLVEIIYEASYWSSCERSSFVEETHVRKAVQEKNYRCAMIEERIQEGIQRDDLIIHVDGERCGEINGLAVYQIGEYAFGKPVRITAKTFMGEKGLVNIEREIRMSGSIHSKGVLTLNGYMGAQYAQDKPLALSASVTFEQSYQGVEGDSASSAELYAILSSLAHVPIYQGIAVTGSVNQNGEIQPVGGVNQKIEGFYKTCRDKGLNGRQGVIIPRQNIANLMLDEEIVEAVRQKKFTIWAVEHIDEGLEILTGLPAGKKDHSDCFETGSVHYLVNRKLQEWSSRRRLAGSSQPNKPTKYVRQRRGKL